MALHYAGSIYTTDAFVHCAVAVTVRQTLEFGAPCINPLPPSCARSCLQYALLEAMSPPLAYGQ